MYKLTTPISSIIIIIIINQLPLPSASGNESVVYAKQRYNA